jgi:hypothetical protein
MTTPIAEEHPELIHYTGIGGLEGIIKSQTLWATHAAFLNDAMEIRAFEARLPEVLRAPVEKFVADSVAKSQANKTLIEQRGGKIEVVKEITTGFVSGMYNALLGTEDVQPFAEPYVTSFCTASTEQIAQHGLLSQWRAYGQDGGYAIVFDTAKLDLLLKEEATKWGYDLFGGNVIYSSDTQEEIRDELGDSINEIQTCIDHYLGSNGNPAKLEKIYYSFIYCACRYKHWGFHEENEVRIIAIPPNKELFEEQRKQGLVKEEKPRWHFVRAGSPVPCIHLFEGITQLPEKPLPITRIIVGPYRNQDNRRRGVEGLLSQYGFDIPVSVSEIPYIGYF